MTDLGLWVLHRLRSVYADQLYDRTGTGPPTLPAGLRFKVGSRRAQDGEHGFLNLERDEANKKDVLTFRFPSGRVIELGRG